MDLSLIDDEEFHDDDNEKNSETAGREGGADEEEIDSEDDLANETRRLVAKQNRKHKKSGGFQSMGFSRSVYNGIIRKGYKIPTPIQRKTIPIILEGKDVVAMARTGSGKTAAFLLPMFEKLKLHSAKSGARALIMSPTRELALQTLKFTKEIGKYTGLKSAVVLGGDSMEDQFAALHENPDIIIATPGRFLHVVMEMDLKMNAVEYVVFDEADRLFEMGFQEQLQEIINRLPETRQTLLFSATLPKLLVEFAKAGLHDPTLIRLDVDTKLSENLKLSFFQCRAVDKTALLIHLLKQVIKPTEQTVLFVATKHHVEYIRMLLDVAGISNTYIYSSLDQTARKINIAKFQKKKSMVMVVTDLAARGIDIPMLDNVINYHFPAKPKLFVHRVGRVARAGRSGTAYSLVAHDEIPYVLDLHLFLGRPMKYALKDKNTPDVDGVYGRVPQWIADDEEINIRQWHYHNSELEGQVKVCTNAFKNYIRSRPAPASESIKRMKEMSAVPLTFHPLFGESGENDETERLQLIEKMRNYRPQTTIFEINSHAKNRGFEVMKNKRNFHGNAIISTQIKQREKTDRFLEKTLEEDERMAEVENSNNAEMEVSEDALQNTFKQVVAPKRSHPDKIFKEKKQKKRKRLADGTTAGGVRDEEFYIPYKPKDFASEKGLSLGSSFDQQAASATLDLTGDDAREMKTMNSAVRWDRKKKKFVGVENQGNKKKIKTESGAWIPASYKSNSYKQWVAKTKITSREEADDDNDDSNEEKDRNNSQSSKSDGGRNRMQVFGTRNRGFHNKKVATTTDNRKVRSELKRSEQILKSRRKTQKMKSFQKKRQIQKQMKTGKS
ncbi:ATP-dependent RNA helicase DDX54-like [Tubulanus polymorphus]|uniref:ATP-dependent RNA helicase DDX54-like n=1 Tax=Tubulanus polymorphus TaxID=672921 RepID=UPI003DA4BE90